MGLRLFEIKVIEKEERESELAKFSLDGTFNHPTRYRFINCFLRYEDGNRQGFTPVGNQGIIQFEGGYCPKFRLYGEAWVVGEIDESRLMESDRFVEVSQE
jgi:hypothetical protein